MDRQAGAYSVTIVPALERKLKNAVTERRAPAQPYISRSTLKAVDEAAQSPLGAFDVVEQAADFGGRRGAGVTAREPEL